MHRPETIVSALLTTLFVVLVVVTNIPSAETQEECADGCRLPIFQWVHTPAINICFYHAMHYSAKCGLAISCFLYLSDFTNFIVHQYSIEGNTDIATAVLSIWLYIWNQTMCLSDNHYHYYYYICLTAFFQNKLGKLARDKQNHSGKTNLDLLKQETVSGSDISWVICKSAPRLRQTTMPAPHHSVFYGPDALPATQPTASKYWRQRINAIKLEWSFKSLQLSYAP